MMPADHAETTRRLSRLWEHVSGRGTGGRVITHDVSMMAG
jgi:hypothetical protein